MPDAPSFYPPAPANVLPEITRPDPAYRLRVIGMIAGLFGFLIVYFILLLAAGLAAIWLAMLPMPEVRGRDEVFVFVFKYGGALSMGLLCLFLIKGLFKGGRVSRSTHVPIVETDFPELFAFIRQVYADVGAPPPARVFVSPEVNAALVYDTSLVNLVIPPKKDLLIGLGLVNVLNLVEFKAILAHEFGHFSQKSVGFGAYLYVANKVMRDVIHSRDVLDILVDVWARLDIYVSFPAWALKGILWIVRLMLAGIYKALNLLHLSLGRQMEYNADNVAVSLTGSDAIIHGLAKTDFANECLGDTVKSLNAAADHGVFTDDLFLHQTLAAGRLRRLRKNDRLGLPPEPPANPAEQIVVFPHEDDGIPDKHRSHPTNAMREQNARRFDVRSPRDDRPAWLLFGPATQLRRDVTEVFYAHMLNRREKYTPRPAAEVREFIEAEHAETTLPDQFHGWYDQRLIDPGQLDPLPPAAWSKEAITAWLAKWPHEDFKRRIDGFRAKQTELKMLHAIETGAIQLNSESFKFREKMFRPHQAENLLKMVQGELREETDAFHALDREVFLVHWSAAVHLGSSSLETELAERYRFHMALQSLLRALLAEEERFGEVVRMMTRKSSLQMGEFNKVRGVLAGVRESLIVGLSAAKELQTPSLANIPAGTALHELIFDRGENDPPPPGKESIEADWLRRLHQRLDAVLERVKRVHAKSCGSILTCQDTIADQWSSTMLRESSLPPEQTGEEAGHDADHAG